MIDDIRNLANKLFTPILPSSHKKIGEDPGQLNLKKVEFPEPVLKLIRYDDESFEQIKLPDIPDKSAFDDIEVVNWFIVKGFGDEEFANNLKARLGIHKLFIEDIVNLAHPPKLEFFESNIVLILRMVLLQEGGLDSTISIVIYKNSLFMFSPDDTFAYEHRILNRLKKSKGIIRERGVDYLLFSIMDIVIDTYYPQIEAIASHIKEVDQKLFEEKNTDLIQEVKSIRQILNIYFDNLFPLKNIISRLIEEEADLIRPEHVKYFNDCQEHVNYLCDRINRLKESTSDIMNLSISINAQKMNEIMKVLTMMSSIFIPLSFICGLYGMNFDSSKSPLNMPELTWYYGYPAVLVLMGMVVVFMIFFFYRKKWF